MTLKHIDHLFQDNRYDLDRCLHNPLGWLEDERRNMEREYGSQISNPGRLLHARQGNGSDGITDTITRGNFYTFLYEPRSARTLPYFDVMPLTLVFETGEGWFRGLNFHYLDYRLRMRLLEHLMGYATTLTGETRILFDWEEARDCSAGHLILPIRGRYWMDCVKTKFKLIEPRHWALMTMLPCEQFAKEYKLKVWKDTMDDATEIVKDYVARHGTPEHVRMLRDHLESLQGPSISITRY